VTLLDGKDIEKLAELSRLEIPAAESDDVVSKLSAVVGLVDQLQAVDTTDVAPMAHPMEQIQRLRADVVTEQDRHELYQRNAPLVERDLYLVPKVIE
jgi:aspartyl-tRNA(Asn)/glutamyl-tRNA(Gln) amidotransferase subunit C